TGLDGAKRFLDRVWRLFVNEEGKQSSIIVDDNNQSMEKMYHETVKKVTQAFKNLHFNTGISQLMVFVNEGYKVDDISRPFVVGFVKLLHAVAPDLGEELWTILRHDGTIT